MLYSKPVLTFPKKIKIITLLYFIFETESYYVVAAGWPGIYYAPGLSRPTSASQVRKGNILIVRVKNNLYKGPILM